MRYSSFMSIPSKSPSFHPDQPIPLFDPMVSVGNASFRVSCVVAVVWWPERAEIYLANRAEPIGARDSDCWEFKELWEAVWFNGEKVPRRD